MLKDLFTLARLPDTGAHPNLINKGLYTQRWRNPYFDQIAGNAFGEARGTEDWLHPAGVHLHWWPTGNHLVSDCRKYCCWHTAPSVVHGLVNTHNIPREFENIIWPLTTGAIISKKTAISSISSDIIVFSLSKNSHYEALSNGFNSCCAVLQMKLSPHTPIAVFVIFPVVGLVTIKNHYKILERWCSVTVQGLWKFYLKNWLASTSEFWWLTGYSAKVCDSLLWVNCHNMPHTCKRWWAVRTERWGPIPAQYINKRLDPTVKYVRYELP